MKHKCSTAQFAENAENKKLNNLCVLAISAVRYYGTVSNLMKFHMSAALPRTASLIEKETLKKRISNIE